MSSLLIPDPGPSTSVQPVQPPDDTADTCLPYDFNIPSCLNPASVFFQVLTAPYRPSIELMPPPHPQPRPGDAARCREMIQWTVEEEPEEPDSPASSADSWRTLPESPLYQPLYEPHGHWAWTHHLPIEDAQEILSLRSGAQCSASIDSGYIADEEIKYICRKWRTGDQTEWFGFYSELALYASEQYLRPLQGVVVPHIIGVHVMPEIVSITMEMPHSSFWIESSPTMPDILKERVIAAFERIHAQGVLHGDPELRHMLIGADGNVMIIDFGMSRALTDHASVGIERAEPEEFRLEMRKVKYKLDYQGAREKEGAKVNDYVRRVRKNTKVRELWRRRAKGERVGPVPQYEEDPEEYELDPPVNVQDFQEDWMTAADDTPARVVVPGQTPEHVAAEVQKFIRTLAVMRSDESFPSRRPAGYPTAHPSSPSLVRQSAWSPADFRAYDEYLEDGGSDMSCLSPRGSTAPTPSSSRIRVEDDVPSRPNPSVHRHRRRRHSRHAAFSDSPSHWDDEELVPPSRQYIDSRTMRRDQVRYRHAKNAYVSARANNPETASTSPPPEAPPTRPRSLKPEEYRWIEESSREAIAQVARAPRSILKRRRDADDQEDEPELRRPRKKLRFRDQRRHERTPVITLPPFDPSLRRRKRPLIHSVIPKRLKGPASQPESIDFTLPSFKTLSTLVGSLMPWVHFR